MRLYQSQHLIFYDPVKYVCTYICINISLESNFVTDNFNEIRYLDNFKSKYLWYLIAKKHTHLFVYLTALFTVSFALIHCSSKSCLSRAIKTTTKNRNICFGFELLLRFCLIVQFTLRCKKITMNHILRFAHMIKFC